MPIASLDAPLEPHNYRQEAHRAKKQKTAWRWAACGCGIPERMATKSTKFWPISGNWQLSQHWQSRVRCPSLPISINCWPASISGAFPTARVGKHPDFGVVQRRSLAGFF